MARKTFPVEINTFVGGLVTDSTPLTFPENSSVDEDNFVLNVEGDRERRLGMDFEENYSEVLTTETQRTNIAHSSFRWENAGGVPSKSILVVQFGNELKFFDLVAEGALSSTLIDTFTLATDTFDSAYDYASVDGVLIVADGEKEIQIFKYDNDAGTLTQSTQTLRIRDLFGVEDIDGSGNDLRDGSGLGIRPTSLTDEHNYNLRNQGWAVPRRDGNNETDDDPIDIFFGDVSKYPSNADTVTQALYPDPNDADNRTIDRFFAEDLESNPLATTNPPRGHFIIDALERGPSRETEYQAMLDRYSQISTSLTSLPVDTTPGGATVVEEFSGRVFYAGFGGNTTGGDDYSPRMSSYILFSRVVNTLSDISRCYQDGDPTSKEEPELLDTDGGFIRLDGAYGIKAMQNIAGNLFVFAENGVWQISGEDRGGFKATSYVVRRISEEGILSKESVIEVEKSVMYWGEDGIYLLKANQFGDWDTISVTSNKFDNFYNNTLTNDEKDKAVGVYDSFEKKARWLFNNDINSDGDTRELVYDVQLNSFYTNTIYSVANDLPKVVGVYEQEPFSLVTSQEDVVVGADTVQASAQDVYINVTEQSAITRSVSYICMTEVSPAIKYTFCRYKDNDFLDFVSSDGTGVDAEAYVVTNYFNGGDFQRKKQVVMMTTYFRKTETGFTIDGNGDFVPENASSCKVQYQWDWTDSADSNRWSSEFQAYRPKRVDLVDNANDSFQAGFPVIINKHKIRGIGHVFAIKFSTEPGKDCHLYGWSLVSGISSDV